MSPMYLSCIVLACLLPMAFQAPTDVPAECGGSGVAPGYGLPCEKDTDCGTRGICRGAPTYQACACYKCERSPEGCCPEEKANCAITTGKMFSNCTKDDDCVGDNTCLNRYIRTCNCPKRGQVRRN